MSDLSFFHGPDAGYGLGIQERFVAGPSSVDVSGRTAARLNPPRSRAAPARLAAENLAFAYRARYHDFVAAPGPTG